MTAAAPTDPRDAEIATLRATVGELLGVVADLRRTVEAQRAHIHKLVKLTFGPRGERVAGPTLFDAVPPADPADVPPPPGDTPASPSVSARPGHGRRRKPADLPRERVVIDLSDAEKVCPGCSAVRVRVGQDVSDRLDYRPASLFVREIVRPTYACRRCEAAGSDPRFRRAPLGKRLVILDREWHRILDHEPVRGPGYLPLFGASSFFAFIDSRNR
jgi:transposase